VTDYIAFLHPGGERGFRVTFPDLPGLAAEASAMEAVWREAEVALSIHVRRLLEAGEAVPAPSTIDTLSSAPGFKDALAVVAVPVAGFAAPTVSVSIVLTQSMLREIDARAAALGWTRAGFLVQAARRALEAA
jgi:predicted RNase H-like HicB family nuclease